MRGALGAAAWVVAVSGSSPVPAAELPVDQAGLDFFNGSVLPLLEANCYECHSHGSGKAKGGLVLDSRRGWEKGGGHGAAVVPGDTGASLLLEAVRYQDEELQMPPDGRLSDGDVAVLRRWIEAGAVDPREGTGGDPPDAGELWSLQPVTEVQPPADVGSGWPLSEVDQFVLARLESEGLAPLADAPAGTLIRRVYFDLVGLPPSPEEMERWLRRFSRAGAAAGQGKTDPVLKLADHLLETPQFGERWARHWLDTARYAESNGNNRNRVFRYAWRYRNWVIDSLNSDQRYDEFLKEQIAGDLMPSADPETRKRRRIATGFLAIGPKPYFPTIVPLDPEEPDRARYDWAAEQIGATTAGMLGLTVGCARCHDHKSDPVPTRDYYALAGIFRSTEPRFGMYHHLFGVDEGQAQRDFLYDWNLLVLNDGSLAEMRRLQERYKPLVIEENRIVLRQRHWPAQVERMEEKLKRQPDLPEAEVARIRASVAERKQQLEADAARLPVLRAEKQSMREAFPFEVDQAMGVEDSAEPGDVHVRIAGEHADRGDLVPRGFLSAVRFEGAPAGVNAGQSGRLELAEWIAHPNNPLTARVAVNRIWYQLFGRGLVNTLDNFGSSGEEPTHPGLLDHLAHRFVHEFGWSRKKLIRYLLGTRTYRTASGDMPGAAELAERDPTNELYGRTVPRRLEAEVIRDSMLEVAGRLDRERPEGSPLTGFEYHADIVRDDRVKALELLGSGLRTIYVPALRGHRHRLYDLFDYPDDEAVNSARPTTTVPTQALFLMNNPLVGDQAAALAGRVEAEGSHAGGQADRKLDRLYWRCYGRAPTPEETEADETYIRQLIDGGVRETEAWRRLAHSFLISSEFIFRL